MIILCCVWLIFQNRKNIDINDKNNRDNKNKNILG
jgi:hypothetical protein